MPKRAGGGGSYSFEIHGVPNLTKALRASDKEFKLATAKKLREIGNGLRNAIRAKAPKGKTGVLKRSVRTKVSRLTVRVFSDARAPDSAKYKGYRYGKRLEFDPAYGGRFEWFYPTWEAAQAFAKRAFDSVLDSVARKYSEGSTK